MVLKLEYSNISAVLLAWSSILPYPQSGQDAVGLNERRLVNRENQLCISKANRLGVQMALSFPLFHFIFLQSKHLNNGVYAMNLL